MFLVEASIPKDLTKEEEKYLKEAEKIVGKEYDKDDEKYWGTVTNIFKAKVEKHLGYDPFVKHRKKRKKEEAKKKKKKESFLIIARASRFLSKMA